MVAKLPPEQATRRNCHPVSALCAYGQGEEDGSRPKRSIRHCARPNNAIGQKAAWFLLHCLCDAMRGRDLALSGPAEAMEIDARGLERTKHQHGHTKAEGRHPGKANVAGVRERSNGSVVVHEVAGHAKKGLQAFTGQLKGYLPLTMMRYKRRSVAPSIGLLVDGTAHPYGLVNTWTTTGRGYHGVRQEVLGEHSHCCTPELQCRNSIRVRHTIAHMSHVSKSIEGMRPTCEHLMAVGVRANQARETAELQV